MGQYRDWATCLDCLAREQVKKKAWNRASKPRCKACGGILEPSPKAREEMMSHGDAQKEEQIRRDKKTNRS